MPDVDPVSAQKVPALRAWNGGMDAEPGHVLIEHADARDA